MDLIATIGPSSFDPAVLVAWMRLGIRCIRFPFSKLQPEDHVRNCRRVRELAAGVGIGVHAMADLPGGKPRLNGNRPVIQAGRRYHIALKPPRHADEELWLDPGLPVSVAPRDEVLVGDGENRFIVDEVTADDLVGSFVDAGTVEWRPAFMPIGLGRTVPGFTEQDKRFAAAAHEGGFDWLALSYVSSPDDVIAARSWLAAHLDWNPYLIAKIETMTGVLAVDSIARAADAVMIARGDLALDVGFDALWRVQTSIVAACASAGRYCIAATGFLESLATRQTPTRAECVDFCSTLDMGADAILFSSETSIGQHPTLVIETAARLAETWTRSRVSRHVHHAAQ